MSLVRPFHESAIWPVSFVDVPTGIRDFEFEMSLSDRHWLEIDGFDGSAASALKKERLMRPRLPSLLATVSMLRDGRGVAESSRVD